MASSPIHSVSVPRSVRARLLLQVLATIAILAFVPGNAAKLAALLVVWVIGFGKLSRAEWIVFIGINLLFMVMNIGALQKGVFRFINPDALGMPMYEFFMWGFYTLNTIRFLDGKAPRGRQWLVVVMAVALAIPFSTIGNAGLLTLVSGIILVISLALFHEPMDFAYVAYMVILGALIEYTGVWAGQWSYPENPPGGVPLWFITMWGGVGLFTRRLVLPLMRRGTTSQ